MKTTSSIKFNYLYKYLINIVKKRRFKNWHTLSNTEYKNAMKCSRFESREQTNKFKLNSEEQ